MKATVSLSVEALREIREAAAGDRLGWTMDGIGREIIEAVTAVVPLAADDFVAVPADEPPPSPGEPSDARGDAIVRRTFGSGCWRGQIVQIGMPNNPDLAIVARPSARHRDTIPCSMIPLDVLTFCT